ncbi:site-specific integrase [Chryseobacterium sp. MEBOG07]|uniref:site-specific integrase n=1 Tax=Chryseobacterium sp. MEBOG07 TaxID=2879939 RepID=UPI001F38D46F|nr:site-specific integrase [Chryseobacterium sp. MEBOG07]UKB78345.1 site-specific integrase [Chryseobacterium sp. MEBOG07]
MKDFAKHLHSYIHNYLIGECGYGTNTIRSYKKGFRLLVIFMKEERRITPDKIELKHLNRNVVLDFLKWLEIKHKSSVSTRNQRYAIICSFCNYLQYEEPDRIVEWQNIRSIRLKAAPVKVISYLTKDGVKLLLDQIPNNTKSFRRDLAMLALLYDSAARVQELCDLTPSSIRFDDPYFIRVLGKGNKERDIPLMKEQIDLLKLYVKENNLDTSEKYNYPLFTNRFGGKLTPAGITYILKKYAKKARSINNILIPQIISPHIFRHSKAMHLVQDGVNLIYIRDLLGHASVITTERYARADSKQKREALETVYEDVIPHKGIAGSWEKDIKLRDFLNDLGCN